MKRTQLIISLLLFSVICGSVAYWALQFLQPAPRPMIAPPTTASSTTDPSSAAALLGGNLHSSAGSNFQLTGVIMADQPEDSIAIVAIDGKMAKPFRAKGNIQSGTSIKEVHRNYVLLEQNGMVLRLDLPETRK